MKKLIILCLIGVPLLFLISCQEEPKEEAKSAAPSGPRTLKADAIIPQKSVLSQKATSTGTFIAEDQVLISSEVSGYLRKIHFQEGDFKRKGDFLAKINDAELQARKNKLAVALAYAKQEIARADKLLSLKAIRSEEVDRLRNDADVIEADIVVLDAQIEKTNVYAPFTGRIGIKMLSEGAYVSPGTGIVELHRLNPIKLEFFIPEKMAGMVSQGDEISFTVPAQKDTFVAKVYLVSPSLDANNRSLRMRCRISNKDNLFMPGGYADVFYDIQSSGGSLLIPAEAIIPILEGQKVLIVKNGKVKSQKVEVGMRTPTSVQIMNGLTAQDTVLVTGILGATDGMKVQATLKDIR